MQKIIKCGNCGKKNRIWCTTPGLIAYCGHCHARLGRAKPVTIIDDEACDLAKQDYAGSFYEAETESAEIWHDFFNPQKLLRGVSINDLPKFSVRSESVVDSFNKPCLMCSRLQGSAVRLNDGSFLCKKCFEVISITTYPEKYERLKEGYIGPVELVPSFFSVSVSINGFRR